MNVTSKLAKEDVVEVVRQLNIVAYERKLNNRHLEIKEKQLVKGFLEGSNQTFISVQTYGKESPLGLVI